MTSDSGVRTGGWVFHAGGAYTSSGYLRRSYIKSLDIKKQVNGLWIAQFELVGIDVAVTSLMEITGGNFFNNKGTGLYVASQPTRGGAPISFSGNTLAGNGQGHQAGNCDGIFLDLAINAIGPVMTGNDDAGETCVSIRTGPTTNRISLVGNRFVSGASFGIAPMISGLNEGI